MNTNIEPMNDDFAKSIEEETGVVGEKNVVRNNPTSLFRHDLTDITDSVETPQLTNQEFLSALFDPYEDTLGGSLPQVLGLGQITQKNWRGERWSKKCNMVNPDLNWYFTLSVYTADKKTKRKVDCTAVCGLMLDDIGTKALPLSRLEKCPPTFVIETSQDNYQAGYLFDVPQTDFKRMDAINKALIEAELCDSGATGVTSRWGRLPSASNTKYDPVFQCRLVFFRPDLRYTPDEIIEGLELAPPDEKITSKKPKGVDKEAKATAIDSRSEDVFLPRSSENEVITALKQKGLYKRPLGGGAHDITCPWKHEHTGGEDHGTAYFEPTDLYPAGGFHCQHSHGDKKKLGSLLAFLEVSFQSAKHKPTIRVSAGELHRICDAAEKELADTGRYFQTGGMVTSIVTDPANGATTIKPLKQNALARAMGRCAIWERFDSRLESWVVTDPTQRHAATVFDAERYDHLPALIGLARQPHIRPGGEVVKLSGFDALSGYYGTFDAKDFFILDRPTQQDALDALASIDQLLSEFSFKTAYDHAAALAAILTAAARSSLELSPMFHVKAPLPGSGKSYLTSIISTFASPSQVAAHSLPTKDEELSKMLMAELMQSPPAIIFDNLTTDLLPYPKLCSALTEPFITDRLLGFSKVVTVSTRTLFLSSGNNVDPIKDMPRRTVTITLDPQVENPITRDFAHDPLTEVRQRRGFYVSQALTVIRAWHVNGKPFTACKAYGSFGQWGDWIRQPLLWLGAVDPVHNVFEAMAHDPDREILGRVLVAWRACFGRQPTLIRDALHEAASASELHEVFFEVAEMRGVINARALGRWIARHASRIVDGLKFERDTAATNSQRWVVRDAPKESVKSVKSVTGGEAGVFSETEITPEKADLVEVEL